MSTAKKAVVVGLDSAGSRLTEKYINEGLLPNMKKIKEKGVYLDAICPFPTITPPNWATISTGVWPGTHGITGFYTHHPGDPLDRSKGGRGFERRECEVEFIWEMAEKEGIGSILINYPASWPPRTKKVWQVTGCGLGKENELKINDGQLFTTDDIPLSWKIELKPAVDWKGMDAGKGFLESELKFELKGGREKTYYLLAGKEVSLHRSKDQSDILATLERNAWSDWIKDQFEIEKGIVAGAFRVKLLDYDHEARRINVYLPEIFPTEGFTEPPELAEEIVEEVGPFQEEPGWVALNEGNATDEEFLELMDYQDRWYGKAATYLMKKKDWGLLFLHAHGIDHAQHKYLRGLGTDKECEENLKRAYVSADNLVGQIYEATDDDTLFIVVSDHGATCRGEDDIDIYEILKDGGLLSYEEPFPGLREIDWGKTKAVPNRSSYVYVNLKGRDPQGIVEPADYDAVRDEVMHCLRAYRHPDTGESPFSILMKKEEARVMGLYGDGIGEIVYSTYPEYSSEHGRQHAGACRGPTSIESLLMMCGPGVKQNHRSSSIVFLTDVVPTICHLMDIPVPPKCEGGIIYDALSEPNANLAKSKKLAKEQEALAKAYKEYRRLSHS